MPPPPDKHDQYTPEECFRRKTFLMQTHRRSLQHISDHETKEQINIKEGVGEVIVLAFKDINRLI